MDILSVVSPIINECGRKSQIEIVDIEWVKEAGSYILRIIADTKEGLTIDESAKLNEMISLKLDEVDFTEEEYFLEVSSPGLEMPIKNEKALLDAINQYICVKTYEKIDNLKEFIGYLKYVEEEYIVIECNIKGRIKKFEIERKLISSIRHAVKF
ncbi:MAG: ribosome maturation factor RimP [Bacilli bacterium]